MPQTREHLAICELLGVDRGLVVLTKADLVDEEMLELAEEEVSDLLADGPLANVPIVAASAQTGDGIDRVRDTLLELVRTAPARADDARPARLHVDRSFVKHGFGAVATGTWTGRPRAVGDAMVLEPGARRVKIRGLERHGEAVEQAIAGARIAVNLQGIEHEAIHRGDLLTEPDALLASAAFDASLHWLARDASLEDAASAELLTGTTERRARVALIGDAPIAPGERGFVRIHVDGPPLHLLPGDRFVLRGFSREAGVGSTIGGGVVLDVAPPHRRRRDPALHRDLETLANATPAEAVQVRITRAGLAGTTKKSLALETGFDAIALDAALHDAAGRDTIVVLDSGRCLEADAARRLMESLRATLERFHESDPLQAGMPRARLLGSLPENVPAEIGSALLDRLVADRELAISGEGVSLAGHAPTLDAEQTRLAEMLSKRLRESGLDAPALRTIAEESGEDEGRLRALAHHLEREGVLVAAPDELFFDRAAVMELSQRVVAHLDANEELDTQTLKSMIGTTRRTAMPLMALLDDLQVTRREGSVRRLRGREPRWQ
ncbi:MAG: SelB C-terminal domain-containing protein [Deltaproteobacteria bacterium]|jgi:selenocysteine-specific elongation factor|nr:SelB C-terminal domain-containing protein [Deltaproteobacteria bacterium]